MVGEIALACVLLTGAGLLLRSLVRVLGAQRHMLEWQTASQAERTTGHSRRSVWKRMWPAVLLGGATMALVAWRGAPDSTGLVHWASLGGWTMVSIAWLPAPEMAIALSAPLSRRDLVLDHDQRTTALRYALRHWWYFDRFVTAETHWLVPDNFQEDPAPVAMLRPPPG